MSHLTSRLNPPANPAMPNPGEPLNPPTASRTTLPVVVHNDNQHGANESFHRPIRHGVAEGEAAPLLIGAYFTAMVFFVCLVLYGLNHQQSETAATTAAEAPAASSPAPAAQAPQPQNSDSQPSQPQQPSAPQGEQPGQPANAQPPQGKSQQQGQQAQPGAQPPAQQNPAPNAQQKAPSPKQ